MSVVETVHWVQRFPSEGFALSEEVKMVEVVDVVNGLSRGGSVASTARDQVASRHELQGPIEVD